MIIACIVHADFEGPGVITDWATNNHHHLKIYPPHKEELCPNVDEFDALIVMGGPQSARELGKFPYLKQEIELISETIHQQKPVIGLCLGAQLIGEALGAETEKSPEKEIGVYPVQLTEEGKKDEFLNSFENKFDVIHWHGDMPGLTSDAKILAHSEGCPRQIIRYNPTTYGFQCHLEITVEGIQDLIDACPADLERTKYTRTKDELLSQDYRPIHTKMIQILDRWVKLASKIEAHC